MLAQHWTSDWDHLNAVVSEAYQEIQRQLCDQPIDGLRGIPVASLEHGFGAGSTSMLQIHMVEPQAITLKDLAVQLPHRPTEAVPVGIIRAFIPSSRSSCRRCLIMCSQHLIGQELLTK